MNFISVTQNTINIISLLSLLGVDRALMSFFSCRTFPILFVVNYPMVNTI